VGKLQILIVASLSVVLISAKLSIGQKLDLENLLQLENKSRSQSQQMMVEAGFTTTEIRNIFHYYPQEQGSFQPWSRRDSCSWGCTGHKRGYENIISYSRIDIKDVKFKRENEGEYIKVKNFRTREYNIYSFAKNYNRVENTATAFIDITFIIENDNCNCYDDFDYEKEKERLTVEIQINDDYEWQSFKKQIFEQATFERIIDMGKHGIIICYRIGETQIRFTEWDDYTTVEIFFVK